MTTTFVSAARETMATRHGARPQQQKTVPDERTRAKFKGHAQETGGAGAGEGRGSPVAGEEDRETVRRRSDKGETLSGR